MVTLFYITSQSRGKSAIPLLDDVKLTVGTYYIPINVYQMAHKKLNQSLKLKSMFKKQMLLFAINIMNTWLPKIIYFDRIYTSIEYKSQQKLIKKIYTTTLFGQIVFLNLVVKLFSITCSRPRHPLCSHSLVFSENQLFIVGIVTICDKELYFF